MPLSATFGFFSSFSLREETFISIFLFLISLLFSSLLLISERPHSAPIFVILLITLLNITKSQATYTATRSLPY